MDEILSLHGRVSKRETRLRKWTPWVLGWLVLGLSLSAQAQTSQPKVSRGQLILPASKGEESSTAAGPKLAQLPAGLPPAPPAANPVLPVGLPPINPALPIGQMPPEKVPVPKIEAGPPPRVVGDGFPPGAVRMPTLGVVGGTPPPPTPKDLAERDKFFGRVVDPKFTLDLVEKRARLLMLNETPRRIQLADESIAIYNLITNKEITILGRQVGTTVMNFWFGEEGKETVISYLVRVFPDPEKEQNMQRIYKALEIEINKNFPDSVVHLRMLGEKVLVTGQARDAIEAANILRVIRASQANNNNSGNSNNQAARQIPAESIYPTRRPGDQLATPGIDDYELSNSYNIVSLLRIVGEHQVNLRCTVAEVNRNAARSVGLNFQYNDGTVNIRNLTGNLLNTGANLPIVLNGGQINLAFNALKTMSYARSIAEPNLTTLNGQPATFRAGGQFPVPVVTGNTLNGLQGVQFVPFGVQMNFTPFITDKDRIRLLIQGNVSTRDVAATTNFGTASVPGLTDRQFGTTVEMREGQTFAIGGLIQNNLGADRQNVPFVSEIPFFNRFTGLDKTSAAEQELVIMVTPELVHPMEQKMVPPLPGTDIFEPSDVEFYLCGRLESYRHYDFRSPVMNDAHRIRKYQKCEQSYIFGPTGYNGPIAP